MNNKSNKTIFRVLLVVTFIYAGMSCLWYLILSAMLPQLQEFYADNPDIMPEQFRTVSEMFLGLPRGYYLASGLLFAMEVVGAGLMWGLRPSGFHCYALARLLLVVVPLLFLGKAFVGVGDVMMAALFILVYWMMMKTLGAFDRSETGVAKPMDGEE